MKKFLLLLIMAAGFALWKGYDIMTDKMKGPTWDNLIPSTRAKTLSLLEKAAAAGLSVMFFEGWRDPVDEAAYIAKGTSKLKDPMNGHHIWGVAVDIVFKNAAGFPSWPPLADPRWSQLWSIAESVGLSHPIAWDGPHLEEPGISIAALRADYGDDYQAFLKDNGVVSA
jgi:hypothetical protein